jgi:hypothetical protein
MAFRWERLDIAVDQSGRLEDSVTLLGGFILPFSDAKV